ncbi:hypothetical protein [Nitrobacter sp.]|uniref:hypothetical protein n=1 Tax=Nitrobacter sp. TaxID=29420 RepID=UPI0029CAB4E0|nr:hypothetical protein [Nitrobacter sp.]
MTSEVAVYERIRSKIATMLDLDVATLTAFQSIRLDMAVCLRFEIDRIQQAQIAGEPIDIGRLANASNQLAELLPPENNSTRLDISNLSDEELSLFETLIAKAAGIAPAIEPPDESLPDPRTDLLARMNAELEELRRDNTTLKINLESARTRAAQFEAQKAAQPEDEAEATPPPGPRIVVDNEPPTYGSHWR